MFVWFPSLEKLACAIGHGYYCYQVCIDAPLRMIWLLLNTLYDNGLYLFVMSHLGSINNPLESQARESAM